MTQWTVREHVVNRIVHVVLHVPSEKKRNRINKSHGSMFYFNAYSIFTRSTVQPSHSPSPTRKILPPRNASRPSRRNNGNFSPRCRTPRDRCNCFDTRQHSRHPHPVSRSRRCTRSRQVPRSFHSSSSRNTARTRFDSLVEAGRNLARTRTPRAPCRSHCRKTRTTARTDLVRLSSRSPRDRCTRSAPRSYRSRNRTRTRARKLC